MQSYKLQAYNKTAGVEERKIWGRYCDDYELIDKLPFVSEVQNLHIKAVHGKNIVLDSGCGPGLITQKLAATKSRKVIGVDFSPQMIKKASNRTKHLRNVRLYEGDVQNLEFPDNYFDAYVSNNVLYILQNPKKFFSEMVRVTKKNGIISISSARPCLDIEILIEAAYAYFRPLKDEEIMRRLDAIASANYALQKQIKNLYEPKDVASILKKHGCKIIEAKTTYLGQSFFVAARR